MACVGVEAVSLARKGCALAALGILTCGEWRRDAETVDPRMAPEREGGAWPMRLTEWGPVDRLMLVQVGWTLDFGLGGRGWDC